MRADEMNPRPSSEKPRRPGAGRNEPNFDAIVVGAGFGGLYMMHKLRNELGLKVRAFDKASGVGGTWYWNRYPGALSDSHSHVYRYSFDKALLQEWSWRNWYLTQPEILEYLEHVADRYELREDIQLNTTVTYMVFDELRGLWTIRTDLGEVYTARFLVNALGLLSAANIPDISGRERFAGEVYHTGEWPQEGVDLAGKRVGVIGTGSTGVQLITAIAPKVGHLTVFQRSPQYSVPTGNGVVPRQTIAEIKSNYDLIWQEVRDSLVAFGFKESTVPAMSVSKEERQAVFQEAWNKGNGFYFMFGTFSDIATDWDANEAAASFIRDKIAEIVDDPETARKLTPQEPYAKRPLCDSGYYRTFNRENVSLVDVKANPIEKITSNGIKTADGVEHALDVLIFATGFDAVDGNYRKCEIRGRSDRAISEHWQNGSKGYLGIATAGFPNMFMILGPSGPFTNLVSAIELQVEWISELIHHMQQHGLTTVEVSEHIENRWVTECQELADQTVFSHVNSWIFGANIPGKARNALFYFGGLRAYRGILAKLVAEGYNGFILRGSDRRRDAHTPG